jgi:hypothetical protein
MSDSTTIVDKPKLESAGTNSRQAIIAGAVSSFLFPLPLVLIALVAGNRDVGRLENIRLLFVDFPILEVFIGGASIITFVVMRLAAGGVFGYLAWLLLRQKRPFIAIIGAVVAGLIAGGILFGCGVVFSVS